MRDDTTEQGPPGKVRISEEQAREGVIRFLENYASGRDIPVSNAQNEIMMIVNAYVNSGTRYMKR